MVYDRLFVNVWNISIDFGIIFIMVYNMRFIFYSSEFFDCWYVDCGVFVNVCNVNDWVCSVSSRYGVIIIINV